MPLLFVDGKRVRNDDAIKLMERSGVEFLFIPCWKTMVKIPEEIVDEAEELALQLEGADETFRWKWVHSYLKEVREQNCVLFVLYSPTKDQAYSRGNYFTHKLGLIEFKRIKKGYYWIKKYPSNLHYKLGDRITATPEDIKLIEEIKHITHR